MHFWQLPAVGETDSDISDQALQHINRGDQYGGLSLGSKEA